MPDDRTIDDLLSAGDVVSLVTGDLRGRPMTVQEVDGSVVRFLVSRSADWVAALADGDRVGLTLADGDDGRWASLTGTAATSTDRELLERLWSLAGNAWFDGPDDPDLAALLVQVADGEWWDAPDSTVARLVSLGAAIVGDGSHEGDQGDVATS